MHGQIHLLSNQPGAVERAYQLARQGKSLSEIRTILRREGYTDVINHILSPSLAQTLRRVAKQARSAAADETPRPSADDQISPDNS